MKPTINDVHTYEHNLIKSLSEHNAFKWLEKASCKRYQELINNIESLNCVTFYFTSTPRLSRIERRYIYLDNNKMVEIQYNTVSIVSNIETETTIKNTYSILMKTTTRKISPDDFLGHREMMLDIFDYIYQFNTAKHSIIFYPEENNV